MQNQKYIIDPIEVDVNDNIVISSPYVKIILDSKGQLKTIQTIKNVENESNTYFQTEDLLECKISRLLTNLGIPASLIGFQYLKSAIKLVVEEPDSIMGVTKVIYPKIAKEYNSTPNRVERSIRTAIERCFDRADLRSLDELFGALINNSTCKLTNSEFIAILAEKFRMESWGCKKIKTLSITNILWLVILRVYFKLL